MKNFISSAIKSLTPVEIERLAIKSGFQKRVPRKITSMELLNLYCLESIDKAPSFNDVAGILNDLAGKHPSRQAVGKRINKEFSDFLKMILEHTINYKIMEKSNIESRTECFPRIIVQDSTIVKLPIRLFAEFSGVSNSHSSVCNARIQGVYDLVAKSFMYFSIDKYSKNDMAAADNLSVQYGDLILRDRGYLKSNEIKRFSSMHTFYIYRHANSMIYRSPKNDEEINLPELLTKEGKIDMDVCLNNKERTVVRLVAAPVSEKTANLRRMKSKIQDSGHNPSKKKLFLMSWTIFITNLAVSKYDFKMILGLYSLRWRIESIFKTWKSNMSFAVIHNVSCHQLHALLMARLISI
ncbi:MAG: IS4 family transposase, partial [Victivallaceae bacterium]|nr:IS4 family transposase [Victivallaceae bacterium]